MRGQKLHLYVGFGRHPTLMRLTKLGQDQDAAVGTFEAGYRQDQV